MRSYVFHLATTCSISVASFQSPPFGVSKKFIQKFCNYILQKSGAMAVLTKNVWDDIKTILKGHNKYHELPEFNDPMDPTMIGPADIFVSHKHSYFFHDFVQVVMDSNFVNENPESERPAYYWIDIFCTDPNRSNSADDFLNAFESVITQIKKVLLVLSFKCNSDVDLVPADKRLSAVYPNSQYFKSLWCLWELACSTALDVKLVIAVPSNEKVNFSNTTELLQSIIEIDCENATCKWDNETKSIKDRITRSIGFQMLNHHVKSRLCAWFISRPEFTYRVTAPLIILPDHQVFLRNFVKSLIDHQLLRDGSLGPVQGDQAFDMYSYLGDIYKHERDYDNALLCYSLSYRLSNLTTVKRALYFLNIGYVSETRGYFNEALDTFQIALQEFENIDLVDYNDILQKAKCFCKIGDMLVKLRKGPESHNDILTNYVEAVHLMIEGRHYLLTAELFLSAAVIFEKYEDHWELASKLKTRSSFFRHILLDYDLSVPLTETCGRLSSTDYVRATSLEFENVLEDMRRLHSE